MSTTTVATKPGRHVAPQSFEAESREYRAERGRVVRIIPGRHVACAAAAYKTEGVALCTLGLGHLNRNEPHAYGPVRPLPRSVTDLAADWTPAERSAAVAQARALTGGAR